MGLSQRQLFIVICIAVALGSGLAALIFLMSRSDPNLRVAALVGTSNIATALIAIASTLLTGRDLTHRDPDDVPPNTTLTEKTTISKGDAQ